MPERDCQNIWDDPHASAWPKVYKLQHHGGRVLGIGIRDNSAAASRHPPTVGRQCLHGPVQEIGFAVLQV